MSVLLQHILLELDGHGRLDAANIEVLREHHRLYGLRLAFSRADFGASLNGDVAGLVTELLRLADLGATAEAAARHPAARRDSVDQLVAAAATSWRRRIR